MSPEMREAYEQILTRSHLEPMKSDIYSLGLLFTFIHGNGNARLVQAISQENARERKASDTLLETEFISSCVYNILIAMLRKQPKDRITIGEVKAYLDAKVSQKQNIRKTCLLVQLHFFTHYITVFVHKNPIVLHMKQVVKFVRINYI